MAIQIERMFRYRLFQLFGVRSSELWTIEMALVGSFTAVVRVRIECQIFKHKLPRFARKTLYNYQDPYDDAYK